MGQSKTVMIILVMMMVMVVVTNRLNKVNTQMKMEKLH